MTTDQRMITAVQTGNDAYINGTKIEALLKDTQASGLKLKEFYGDKAYFKKSILEKNEEMKAEAYIPVSGSTYRIDESAFSYNKDSDQWFCRQGNETVNRKYYKRKRKDTKSGFQEGYKYYFDLKTCKSCPKHDECAKKQREKFCMSE